jgi:hypothetical protein
MPRADVGTESTSTSGGKKGEFRVRFKEIAEKTMKPKDPDSPFKESLRVVYAIEGAGDDAVSLGVTIEDPADDLWGFVSVSPDQAPANNEAALRQFIEANAVREVFDVYVNGFIRSRLAPEGTHTFERILGMWTYSTDGGPRIGMTAVTKDGLTTTWSCKDPQLQKEVGQSGPDADYIGGDGQLNPNQYVFIYLQNFGLDWEAMQENLKTAEAYWPRITDMETGTKPLFPSLENPWPGFLAMIDRWNPVKMEITRHAQYGLGPKRVGQFPIVKMTPIERDESGAEFGREKALFLELWDNLTKAVLSRDDARFIAGANLTEDGKAVALATLKPLVVAHPQAVTAGKNPDGSPALCLPPEPQTWTLDGLVAANFTAERLLALEAEDLFNVVKLNDPAPFTTWAAEAVPEWADVGREQAAEVL